MLKKSSRKATSNELDVVPHVLWNLANFAGRGQVNIDGLGDKVVRAYTRAIAARYRRMADLVALLDHGFVEHLSDIEGVGEVIAQSLL